MRITKRTNIAMRILMFCAVHKGRLVTKAEIADVCRSSEHHLAQVVNQLAQLGYLKTLRGRCGGIELGRDAKTIKVGEIFREIDGDASEVSCFADVDDSCPLVDACRLRDALAVAVGAFYASLDDVSLDALVCDNSALRQILSPRPCVSQMGL
ncbi:Rrf2 family transcriptional regulator [Cognatishimia sp. WU-CL00825]|uniref:RrF2 family transcriptional regulator n=1 Tax=Cognatishimia sp. WU-CL00825 TaxID=3127658 RepID=UPI00310AC45B